MIRPTRLLVALSLSTVAIATAGCSTISAPTVAAAGTQGAASARTVLELRDGWKFRFGDQPDEVTSPQFADADWDTVSVPHTWNRAGFYAWQSRTDPEDAENKEQGAGWYRLDFTAPAVDAGGRSWLEFDAASRVADVWLNGVKLGTHEGGFSRFRLDATPAIHAGDTNSLVVRVDNSQPVSGSPTADTFPLTGDFFVYGGLYRPVRLITTAPAHFAMDDYGGPGVYATTSSISNGSAVVDLSAKLANQNASPIEASVVFKLIDATGMVAATQASPVRIGAGGSADVTARLNVPQAHLWQGIDDPYLYNLVAELRGPGNSLLDSKTQAFGIRQIRIDPEEGLFLNGQHLALHGVGLHQDRQPSGWAMSESEIAATMATIVDMGANTIRLTHYQHGQPIHDLADRYGLILWDEIPVVTAWTHRDDKTDVSPGLAANARQQLKELIRQNYNHPSVAVWGVANEVDFGPNRPDFLGRPPEYVASPRPLLEDLVALARKEDPARSQAQALCCVGRDDSAPPIGDVTPAIGVNRYHGWYYGKPEDLAGDLDAMRVTHAEEPLSVSEYGAGAGFTIQTDNPLGGPIDAGGFTQPEGYQTWYHMQSWPILADRNYLWATWLWNAFDFSTTVRREGDSTDINTKGLVSYDGKVRKDAFYYYRANWSDKPTVHINGRRYKDRAYQVTDVTVFSNAPSTSLSLNGRDLGVQTDCPNRVCTWSQVHLAEGDNSVVATGAFPSGRVADSVSWNLAPSQVNSFRIDSGAIVAASSTSGQFGSDAFFDGGRAGSTDKHPRGRPAVLAVIANTRDRDIAATFREGSFAYRVPLPDGTYRVDLDFVSPEDSGARRVFDVIANGKKELGGFDLAAASPALTAVRRSFDVTVSNGSLNLQFVPIQGEAIVSAISIARRD